MGERLAARAVSEEERRAVKRLAHARRAPARTVERAQVVELARIRLQAHVCGEPESDRTLVEEPALAGAQRSPLCELGRHPPNRGLGDDVLERPQASICLGTPLEASPASPAGYRAPTVID